MATAAAVTLQEAKERFLGAAASSTVNQQLSSLDSRTGYRATSASVGGAVRFADPIVQFLPPLPSESQRRESALYAASAVSMLSALSASSGAATAPASKSPQTDSPSGNHVDSATLQQITAVMANVLQMRRTVKQQTLDLYLAMGNHSRFLFQDLFEDNGTYDAFAGFKPAVEAADRPVGLTDFDECVAEKRAMSAMAVEDREALLAVMPLPPPVDDMLKSQEVYNADCVEEDRQARDRNIIEDTVRHVAFQNQHRFMFDADDRHPNLRKGPRRAPAETLEKGFHASGGSLDPIRVLSDANLNDEMHKLLEVETIDCQVMLSYIMQAAAVYNSCGSSAPRAKEDDHAAREGSTDTTPSITPIQSVNHGVSSILPASSAQVIMHHQLQVEATALRNVSKVQSGKRGEINFAVQGKSSGVVGGQEASAAAVSPPLVVSSVYPPQISSQPAALEPVVIPVRPPGQSSENVNNNNSSGTSQIFAANPSAAVRGKRTNHHQSFTSSSGTNTTTSAENTTFGAAGGVSAAAKSPGPNAPVFVDLADSAAAGSILQQQNSSSSTKDTSTQRTGVATQRSRASSGGAGRSGSKKSSSGGGIFSCFRRSASSSSSSSSSASEDEAAQPDAAQRPAQQPVPAHQRWT
jgi:hypothetical protein